MSAISPLLAWKGPGCRIVCRPDRTEPRKWTLTDLERVAGYVERGGVPWIRVLAAIAVAAGLGVVICIVAEKVFRIVDAWIKLRAFILRPGILLVWIRAIVALLRALEAIKIVVPSPFRAAVVAVIAILTVLLGQFELFAEIDSDITDLQQVAGTIDELCQNIREFLPEV